MILHHSLFFLCILSYQILDSTKAEPIVGKNVIKVSENEYPFIVSLHGYSRHPFVHKKHFCGGTLISQNHVLTAAHCILENSFMKSVEVVVGSPNLKSRDLKRLKLKEWLKFKDWAHKKGEHYKKGYSDIAVIKLDVDDTGIRPVDLLPKDEVLSLNSDFILAGWGITNGGSLPTIMRKVPLKVISKVECLSRVDYLKPGIKTDLNHDSALCFMATPYALGLCRVSVMHADQGIVWNPGDNLLLTPEDDIPSCRINYHGPIWTMGDSGSPFLDEKLRLVGIHSGRCPMVEGFHHLQVNLAISINYAREFIEHAKENI